MPHSTQITLKRDDTEHPDHPTSSHSTSRITCEKKEKSCMPSCSFTVPRTQQRPLRKSYRPQNALAKRCAKTLPECCRPAAQRYSTCCPKTLSTLLVENAAPKRPGAPNRCETQPLPKYCFDPLLSKYSAKMLLCGTAAKIFTE